MQGETCCMTERSDPHQEGTRPRPEREQTPGNPSSDRNARSRPQLVGFGGTWEVVGAIIPF